MPQQLDAGYWKKKQNKKQNKIEVQTVPRYQKRILKRIYNTKNVILRENNKRYKEKKKKLHA